MGNVISGPMEEYRKFIADTLRPLSVRLILHIPTCLAKVLYSIEHNALLVKFMNVCTISLRFLDIILRVLRSDVSV